MPSLPSAMQLEKSQCAIYGRLINPQHPKGNVWKDVVKSKCRNTAEMQIKILIIAFVVVGTWSLLVTHRRKTAMVNEGELVMRITSRPRSPLLVQPYWLTVVTYLKFPIILLLTEQCSDSGNEISSQLKSQRMLSKKMDCLTIIIMVGFSYLIFRL